MHYRTCLTAHFFGVSVWVKDRLTNFYSRFRTLTVPTIFQAVLAAISAIWIRHLLAVF